MKNWGEYARQWQADRSWVHIEDPTVNSDQREKYLECLGDEWGDKASVDQFVMEFIAPHLNDRSLVLEIGSGGGRIVRRVARECGLLVCLDVELEMACLCRRTTMDTQACWIISSKNRAAIPLADSSLDFIYSFDTLVHLNRRLIYQYLREASRTIKPGARMVLHVATDETAEGWRHFTKSVDRDMSSGQFGSFEYIDSHDFLRMAGNANFSCLDSSLGRRGNFYYERDAIFLLEKSQSDK